MHPSPCATHARTHTPTHSPTTHQHDNENVPTASGDVPEGEALQSALNRGCIGIVQCHENLEGIMMDATAVQARMRDYEVAAARFMARVKTVRPDAAAFESEVKVSLSNEGCIVQSMFCSSIHASNGLTSLIGRNHMDLLLELVPLLHASSCLLFRSSVRCSGCVHVPAHTTVVLDLL